MYRSFIIFILIGLLSCSSQSNNPAQAEKLSDNNQITQPIEIIGKTLVYQYGKSIYHVTIDNESEMHWEAMSGDEKGHKAEETYKMDRLDDQTIFITWGEENGIGVSQVLDFKKGIVYNHLLRGRQIDIGKGKISILTN